MLISNIYSNSRSGIPVQSIRSLKSYISHNFTTHFLQLIKYDMRHLSEIYYTAQLSRNYHKSCYHVIITKVYRISNSLPQ
jgi:hypothetical protein